MGGVAQFDDFGDIAKNVMSRFPENGKTYNRPGDVKKRKLTQSGVTNATGEVTPGGVNNAIGKVTPNCTTNAIERVVQNCTTRAIGEVVQSGNLAKICSFLWGYFGWVGHLSHLKVDLTLAGCTSLIGGNNANS